MSKKIAQLTKVRSRACSPGQTMVNAHVPLRRGVGRPTPHSTTRHARAPQLPTPQVIYHLNNRNEDCEFELQELAGRADAQLAAAKADAAAKLAARQQLQDALDERKVAGATPAAARGGGRGRGWGGGVGGPW